jgi:hypothetical protein
MHSWKTMIETMDAVDRPNIGFQADMAHTLLYLLGYNRPEDRILPENFDWNDREALVQASKQLQMPFVPIRSIFMSRRMTAPFSDRARTTRPGDIACLQIRMANMDIATDAGYWMRISNGQLTKAFKHICWDGCMFPNEVLTKQQTWNDILRTMIKVRSLHGWYEAE